MQSENLRPGVTLEWPKASAFKLSYTDISVYSLQLRNTNRKPVAVDITFSAPGCLLRPTRFLVPGYRAPADPPPRTATTNPAAPADPATSTTLTLAIQPGFTFEREAFQRTETLVFLTYQRHFTNELNDCKSPGDLNYLFDIPNEELEMGSVTKKLTFSYIPPTEEEEKAASAGVSLISIKDLVASRLTFQYITPGYVTAYLFIKCTLAAESSGCTAWRLTPPSPSFWYSLQNACRLGEFQPKGVKQDQYAFGYLSPGESHFSYLDLKAYGKQCFQNGAFKGEEQVFVLKAFPLAANPRQGGALAPETMQEMKTYFELPFEGKQKLDMASLLPNNLVELLAEEKPQGNFRNARSKAYTFLFNGPYNPPQSASFTLSNKSKTHALLYRVFAQEPSLVKFNGVFGKLFKLLPKQATTLKVELHSPPGVTFKLRAQLFRLDTFLAKKIINADEYLLAMKQSMDARQMETTFIPCIFKDEVEEKALPEETKQTPTAEAASSKSTGSTDKQMAMVDKQSSTESSTVPQPTGSTVKSPSGAANYSPQPSPGTPLSKQASTLPKDRPTQDQRLSYLGQSVAQLRSRKGHSRQIVTSPRNGSSPKSRHSPGVRPSSPGAKSKWAARNRHSRHQPRAFPAPTGNPTSQDIAVLFCFLLGNGAFLGLLNGVIASLE